MKKLFIAILFGSSVFANNLPSNLVCKKVKKTDVEAMAGVKFKKAQIGKIPFKVPYDVSFCNYINSAITEFSIYYFKGQESYNTIIAQNNKEKKLKKLDFEAKVVITPKDGKIVQLIAKTKRGVLSFVFLNGIKDNNYTKALNLMKKLRGKFK